MSEGKTVARLSPLHAVVFACIFQNETKAGPAMLEFLNAILAHVKEEPIEEILSMKSEYLLMGESAYQKYGRLDVRVKAAHGRIFDMEVQLDKDFVNERGYFYGGRMGTDELEVGTAYHLMPVVRVINIVDFFVKKDYTENVVEPVIMVYANDRAVEATDKFRMYHIQLPAFRRKYKKLESVKHDALLTWLYMLDRGYKNDDEMAVLSEMTEGLRNFAKQYHYAINDPELIRRYRFYEDGQRDIASRIAVAVNEAVVKTADSKTREIALKLKQQGVPDDLISQVTGLAIQDIAEL